MWGHSMMKALSKTLTTICLSTGESELSALVKGAAEGMGMRSLLNDLGVPVTVEIQSDVSAVLGITARQGLGRVRHIAVSDLWVQQRIKNGDAIASKLPGSENPSDLMTKPLDANRIQYLLSKMNVWQAS